MDLFLAVAQQGSAGRGWAGLDGGSLEGPRGVSAGLGGTAGPVPLCGSPIAVVNRGWGWFGKGLWGRGSQLRQGDQCHCWGQRGQHGLVGPAVPWGQWDTGNSSCWPLWGQLCPFLVWRGENNPARAGQEVRAAVQGLEQAVV